MEMQRGVYLCARKTFRHKKWFFLVLLDSRGKYRITMTRSLLERKFLWRHSSKSRKANNLKFCRFTCVIRTIIGTKFQINRLAITLHLFSGSGPKSHPSPRSWRNLKIAVGYRVKLKLCVTVKWRAIFTTICRHSNVVLLSFAFLKQIHSRSNCPLWLSLYSCECANKSQLVFVKSSWWSHDDPSHSS